MAETQTEQRKQEPEQQPSDEETRTDAQGNEIDNSANIPEEQEGWEDKDVDQTAKHNDLGEGHHKNSTTFGKVTSHYAPDAAGTTPEDLYERSEARMGHDEEEMQEKRDRTEAAVQKMEERKEERQEESDKSDDDAGQSTTEQRKKPQSK